MLRVGIGANHYITEKSVVTRPWREPTHTRVIAPVKKKKNEIITCCGDSHSVLALCVHTGRIDVPIGEQGHINIITNIIALSDFSLLRPVTDTAKWNPSIVQIASEISFSRRCENLKSHNRQ
jgi:hypothetical protein